MALYIVCLFGFEIFLLAFRFLDWGQGLARGALLGLVMLLLLALRVWPPRVVLETGGGQGLRRAVLGVLAIAAAWDLSMMALATYHTARTGEIRLDQGQTTYRAARELRSGFSPYRQGALLDPNVYTERMSKRVAAGLAPTIPASAVDVEMDRYWATLDPALRQQLLPAVPPNGPASARLEASILGYKYGPVPLLLTAALAPLMGPPSVSILNGAACLAMFTIIALILYRAGAGIVVGGLALSAVAMDPWITYSYLRASATDVWPLLFGFGAVLSAMSRRDRALGVCVALALASKLLPAVLYLPLLLAARSPRAGLAFGVALLGLFGPWVVWDAHGLLYNYLLWGVIRDADSTSWLYNLRAIALPVQALLGGFVVFLAYSLIAGRARRWAWLFGAMSLSVVMGASAFHNNYIPWFSAWVPIAIAEAFSLRGRPVPGSGLF